MAQDRKQGVMGRSGLIKSNTRHSGGLKIENIGLIPGVCENGGF